MKTIFVNIASFLDHQVLPTLEDALIQAKYPERLHICIIHQHADKDKFLFDDYINNPNINIINIPSIKARGPCYARHLGNQQYQGEDYVFMCDSHTRFIKNWDEEFINMHNRCLKTSKKPCITSYCPLFEVNSEERISNNKQMFPAFKDHSGVLRFKNIDKLDNELRQHAFWGACLSFSDGRFFQEVPYDPNLYFFGEEISIAIRAWTRGWDFYLPDKIIIEHDYAKQWGESRRKRHQSVSISSEDLNTLSLEKVKKICLGEISGIYGLGDQRTLEEYEASAGISFKDQYIWHGNNLSYRSFPAFNSYKEFSKHIIKNNRFTTLKLNWANHKELISEFTFDAIKVSVHWEDRYKVYDLDHIGEMIYECSFENYPIDNLAIFSSDPCSKEEYFNMCEIHFYKRVDGDLELINNFCINDGITLSFTLNNKTHTAISKNNYYKPDYIKFPHPNELKKNKSKINSLKLESFNNIKDRILFIHIPKTAGISVRSSIVTFWDTKNICFYHPSVTHFNKKDALNWMENYIEEDQTTLSVFRDPYDRLLSAYRYGFRQAHNPFHKLEKVAGSQENKSLFYNKPYNFNQFVKNLYTYYMENKLGYFFEFILRQQSSFIEDSNHKINNCYIIDYANLNTEWDLYCDKFNFKNRTKLLNLNVSSKKINDYMNYYNNETIKMVEKIYKKDIKIYKQIRTGDYICQKLVEKNSHILKKV